MCFACDKLFEHDAKHRRKYCTTGIRQSWAAAQKSGGLFY